MKNHDEIPGYFHVSNVSAFNKETMRAETPESINHRFATQFKLPVDSFITIENQIPGTSKFACYVENEHAVHIKAWHDSIREMLEVLESIFEKEMDHD